MCNHTGEHPFKYDEYHGMIDGMLYEKKELGCLDAHTGVIVRNQFHDDYQPSLADNARTLVNIRSWRVQQLVCENTARQMLSHSVSAALPLANVHSNATRASTAWWKVTNAHAHAHTHTHNQSIVKFITRYFQVLFVSPVMNRKRAHTRMHAHTLANVHSGVTSVTLVLVSTHGLFKRERPYKCNRCDIKMEHLAGDICNTGMEHLAGDICNNTGDSSQVGYSQTGNLS